MQEKYSAFLNLLKLNRVFFWDFFNMGNGFIILELLKTSFIW